MRKDLPHIRIECFPSISKCEASASQDWNELSEFLSGTADSSSDGIMTTTSLTRDITKVAEVRNYLKYLPLECDFRVVLLNRCNHQTKTGLASEVAVLL